MKEKYNDWQKALERLESVISKDIEAIHEAKREVQDAKLSLADLLSGMHYERNSRGYIFSAPHIVIGDVDRDGVLIGDTNSTVTIRANNIRLEGVSGKEGPGLIISRSSRIMQEAVNPGADGFENVVEPDASIITSHALRIGIQSDNAKDHFTKPVYHTDKTGIRIHADENLAVSAAVSNQIASDNNSSSKATLSAAEAKLRAKVAELKLKLTASTAEINTLLTADEALIADVEVTRISYDKIMDIKDKFVAEQQNFYALATEFYTSAAELAEVVRQQKALDDEKSKLAEEKDQYKSKRSTSRIDVNTELLKVTNADDDGNIYTTPVTGSFFRGKQFVVTSVDDKNKLIDDSIVTFDSQTVSIATFSPDNLDETLSNGAFQADGHVRITSKKIDIESADYDLKDGKLEEKALAAGSTINIRAEKVDVNATDTQGKVTGKVVLNAKDVEISGVDVDEKSREAKDKVADTTLTILTDKVAIGKPDDKSLPAQVTVDAKQIVAKGKETTDLSQGDDAKVELAGGNLSIKTKKNEVSGDLTVNDKAEFKSDVTGTNLKANKVEASASLKSPNISDGM